MTQNVLERNWECWCLWPLFHPPPLSREVNNGTEPLCSTRSSCLDGLCPLSPRPAPSTESRPWLSGALWKPCTNLRAAERRWCDVEGCLDLTVFQSLLVHPASPLQKKGSRRLSKMTRFTVPLPLPPITNSARCPVRSVGTQFPIMTGGQCFIPYANKPALVYSLGSQ